MTESVLDAHSQYRGKQHEGDTQSTFLLGWSEEFGERIHKCFHRVPRGR